MKEITGELQERNCVICMNCGRIYEATREEYDGNDCLCGMGWFNYVTGCMDIVFWGSPAADALLRRELPFEGES